MKKMTAALAALVLLTGVSCRAGAAFIRQTADYFGTVSMLCLYEEEGAQDTWEEIKALLGEIEAAVSFSVPDSDIARFNALEAGGRIAVSEITAEILAVAEEAFEMTGGLYDPTVFPLVDLWGFSPRFNTNRAQRAMPYDRPQEDGHPAPAQARDVQALLPLVGFGGVITEQTQAGTFVTKATPSVSVRGVRVAAQMDLGGIAKGYACDRVRALLKEKGYREGYFVCGGSSMAFLSGPEGKPLTVTAGHPRDAKAEPYASLAARETTLSTSSDESHGYRVGGTLYCHIIDPRTGYPLNTPVRDGPQRGTACVTLLCHSAALGDALSTALCLMGPEEALRFLEGRDMRMVMAVCRDGEEEIEVVSNAERGAVTLPPEGCRWACGPDGEGRIRYTGEWLR